jgi:hypothetical protein
MFIRALSVCQGGISAADIIMIMKELVSGRCYLRKVCFVSGSCNDMPLHCLAKRSKRRDLYFYYIRAYLTELIPNFQPL